jgi:hypothetical protein
VSEQPKAKPYHEPVQQLGQTFEVAAVSSAKDSKLYHPKDMLGHAECGKMVKVRPVGEEYGDKTYLGVYLGEFAQGVGFGYDAEDKCLFQKWTGHNPAIFIPGLNKIVYGYESWWSTISSATELEDITDEDIQQVWYVRALRESLSNVDDEVGHA